jgi:fructose-1,6-bisphosphatase/inositol monophosphatase family enzyme
VDHPDRPARGRPTGVGVIAQPYLDEIFIGGPNGARLLRGETETPMAVRACAT